jgi:hypothetical protein
MLIRFIQPRWFIRAARLLLLAMLLLMSGLWPSQPVVAQAGITAPATSASVSGDVPIMGTAVIDPFQKYELHYKMEPSNNDAYIYFAGATTPVVNGQLGVWQAGGLPPGIYSLRLRVVKVDGNYAEYYSQNISVNQGAAETQTPTVTPTSSEPTATPIPTATFTPAPQPTVAVGQVAQPSLENPPTPTPTAEAVALVAGSEDGQPLTTTLAAVTNSGDTASEGSLTRELGEALSPSRLRGQFFNGMRISAALFLGVIALYAGKRLFDWVWTQFS